MAKKRTNCLAVKLNLLLLLFIASPSYAKSFDSVFEWINRFQDGEKIELKVHINSESLIFFHNQKTNIDQATFEKLIENKKSLISPQIKILSNSRFLISYELDNQFSLEETFKGVKPIEWKKVEFVNIASYTLRDWTDFIKQAIYHGLVKYELIEYEKDSYSFLVFKQTGASRVQFGKSYLTFSDEFYEYMKISNEFEPRPGNKDRFVILVHEPHWFLGGQYQLISGIKALININPQYDFAFLVEGDFDEENKYISTKPILAQFSKDVSFELQVFTLLRNFLIDGPLAYRLLYNPDLPAISIDNPELIKKAPRLPNFKNWADHEEILLSLASKLGKLPKEKTNEIVQNIILLSHFVRADSRELKGQAAIDYFSQVERLYDDLSNQLKHLSTQDFKEEISFLKDQAENYRIQMKILEYALERDNTMAKNIIGHFKSSYSQRIPIVFIGSFHTPGIIDRISRSKIGFVVIEPQVSPLSLIPSKEEQDNFKNALEPSSRLDYLKKLSGTLKLKVAPSKNELPYYKSILRDNVTRIKSQRNNLKSSSPFNPDVTARIEESIKKNGILSNARISFTGVGGIILPPKKPDNGTDSYDSNNINKGVKDWNRSIFSAAFAAFYCNTQEKFSRTKIPEMRIFDLKEKNWEQEDRLNFLEKALFISPYEKIKEVKRTVSFYQDKETNRMFFSIFDSESQGLFMFEWKDGANLYDLLKLPEGKSQETTTIHFRLSIRETIYQKKGKKNG